MSKGLPLTAGKYFHSNQKFTSGQSLLGKSKFISLHDLLDPATGYLDETGRRAVLELQLSRSTTRFERVSQCKTQLYFFSTQFTEKFQL